MPRKGPVAKRDVLPDPIYNSKLVSRLINKMMIDGKKGKSQTILYKSFDIIKERTGNDAMEVFEQALKNIMPVLEVKAFRNHLGHSFLHFKRSYLADLPSLRRTTSPS